MYISWVLYGSINWLSHYWKALQKLLWWPPFFCLSHCVGNPDLLCPRSFPAWRRWCQHPSLHRATSRSTHPLPSDLRAHLLQPHYLHPYHLHSLPQQRSWRASAAFLQLEPAAAGRRWLPAAQVLRQSDVPGPLQGGPTVVVLYKNIAISYWCTFNFDWTHFSKCFEDLSRDTAS